MDEKQVNLNNCKIFSSWQDYEYYCALFDIRFIYVDKIMSELLKINDADRELFLEDDHIKKESGIGYA